MVFYFKKAYVQALLCLEICKCFKMPTKECLKSKEHTEGSRTAQHSLAVFHN
jgi:hypothetical protein